MTNNLVPDDGALNIHINLSTQTNGNHNDEVPDTKFIKRLRNEGWKNGGTNKKDKLEEAYELEKETYKKMWNLSSCRPAMPQWDSTHGLIGNGQKSGNVF